MRIGAAIFATDRGIHPAELARELEARGFESLWLPEHTHIPVSRRTPYPGGGELPDYYARALDPFVALGAAATATTKLLLGTGVCLVIERDPIVLAKEVATLDWLSGGRALFGVGGGWNREEMRNHGTDPATRWELMRERILAMKEIWTRDEAEFHGRFVDFDPIWSWPKPVQRPHPPIVVGGDGVTTFDRVLEYGDAWMPIVRPGGPAPFPGPPRNRGDGVRISWGGFPERIAELRRRCEEAGRPPVPVTAWPSGRIEDAHLEEYGRLGVERVIVLLPPDDRDRAMRSVERYTPMLARHA
jgi:probable F420-dependent oxidoreductase